jgi:hypothetical protein
MALRLLSNPLALYQAAKQRTRNVINKAIFTKLYVDADPEGPYVASEELNEPFEALERQEGVRLTADTSDGSTRADLLAMVLGAPCSSKNALVGTTGFEPVTPRL